MADLLAKYGLKEVSDVVFYELDDNGAPSAPVLYLDSLKVSTLEQSAEVVDATGGKGNVKLISWDTNKEITLTLEDALFSVQSLAMMFGGSLKQGTGASAPEVLKTVQKSAVKAESDNWAVDLGRDTVYIEKTKATYFKADSDSVEPATSADFDFMTFDLLDAKNGTGSGAGAAIKEGLEIRLDANTFGGTYYICGDTYVRNQKSLKDEYFQLVIPKGKMSSEDLTLTMEADGDPSTFNMNIKVMRANDGTMVKLIKYNIDGAKSASLNKGVASVVADYSYYTDDNYTSDASRVTP
jgi:hypothetical protein